MSSFFTKPASERKRKRLDGSSAPARKRQTTTTQSRSAKTSKPRKERDDSVSDVESDVSQESAGEDNASETSSIDNETNAEKRLRLAEQYLANIREEVDEAGFDAADIDRDLIAERLQEDVAESKGKVYRHIAGDYEFEEAQWAKERKDFKSLTSVATSADGKWAYTVSKDMMIIKWEIPDVAARRAEAEKAAQDETEQKEVPNGTTEVSKKKTLVHVRRKPIQRHFVRGRRSRDKDPTYLGHTNAILCAACSPDGRFLATGGRDNRLVIWDTATMQPLKLFTQHRGAVNGLAFRRGTNQLFSASADRSVKVWSLDELAYVETLFGHQDEVLDVGALGEEKCVTVGARDRTARLWKVVEEQQLLFRGVGVRESKSKNKTKGKQNGTVFEEMQVDEPISYAENTMDRIALLSNDMFVTGSSNGALSLWSAQKKKPIFVYHLAHGLETPLSPQETSAEADEALQKSYAEPQPRYITALRAVPYSDLLISGSWDGWIRCWQITEGEQGGRGKRIEPVGVLGKVSESDATDDKVGLINGIVNDLSVFERGDRGKDGLCVVAAVGPEHRLGRWARQTNAKPAIWVFEIPKKLSAGKEVNGVETDEELAN